MGPLPLSGAAQLISQAEHKLTLRMGGRDRKQSGDDFSRVLGSRQDKPQGRNETMGKERWQNVSDFTFFFLARLEGGSKKKETSVKKQICH